ncbi:MAG TPA: isoprenylcysteine carboxylmethyltransferase family protein [Candidatus Binataceae bacterium]|nr:isoprenylcysteine carboxylmethyltransferase family protein [Candidatus Binataceae bacterium]
MKENIAFRLIIAAQLIAMGVVRAYFGAPRGEESAEPGQTAHGESAWLTATLGILAILHFGAVFLYLVHPPLLRWSALEIAAPIRWIALVISCLGAAGEIWAAVSLGTSYSPMLRVAKERVVVTAGPYRWIRHPLYAFGLPMMAGWGIAADSWFILASGTVLITVLMIIRVPREEAMMLEGFGESYRDYMTRTGRFVPRWRRVRPK